MDRAPSPSGQTWCFKSILTILGNEKYCGDVLMQKTYVEDCISRKVRKNNGKYEQYIILDHHEPIVSRENFDAVQAELARRNAGKGATQKSAPTGRTRYSGKYALTERLVCGECGTLHRRCVWTHHGQRREVWRCASRIDYGSKYCKHSPTLDEKPLQNTILAAINSVMRSKAELISDITTAMRTEMSPARKGELSIGDLDRAIAAQEHSFQTLFDQMHSNEDLTAHAEEFKQITDTLAELKQRKKQMLEQQSEDATANRCAAKAASFLESQSAAITEWDESMIRQLIDTVKVLSADRIKVCFHGGIEIEQDMVK